MQNSVQNTLDPRAAPALAARSERRMESFVGYGKIAHGTCKGPEESDLVGESSALQQDPKLREERAL